MTAPGKGDGVTPVCPAEPPDKLPRVDRLLFAAQLARGHRVLDIGGVGMPVTTRAEASPPLGRLAKGILGGDRAHRPARRTWASSYADIVSSAAEYRVVDYHDVGPGHFCLDLNQPGSPAGLREAIHAYRPQVILCMEMLEHINYHFEAMNAMAEAVTAWGARVYITLPNNGNWILNALGWNHDHSIGFLRNIAWRFVTRSQLGTARVEMQACMQTYTGFWPLIYLAAGLQPFSWGFLVSPRDPQAPPSEGPGGSQAETPVIPSSPDRRRPEAAGGRS